MDKAELIDFLETYHPYPDDLFIPPTKKEWDKLHEILGTVGMSGSAFAGHACRIGYEACISMIQKQEE